MNNCSYINEYGMMEDQNNQQYLTDMKDGQIGLIIAVEGGRIAAKRLADMGITPGTAIRVIRKTLFRGPVQIEVRGSRLVLGRGLASRIMIESR
jgi:DtxR family transcriptional regulator, Mn-dependent transcriptional regulator